jgi:hypothetical protein
MNHLLSLQSPTGSFYWYGTMIDHPEWMTSYAVQALSYAAFPVNIDYEVCLAGDFDVNNNIDYVDIGTFVDQFIAYYSSQPWDHDADFDGNNVIDYVDIGLFVDYFIGYYS